MLRSFPAARRLRAWRRPQFRRHRRDDGDRAAAERFQSSLMHGSKPIVVRQIQIMTSLQKPFLNTKDTKAAKENVKWSRKKACDFSAPAVFACFALKRSFCSGVDYWFWSCGESSKANRGKIEEWDRWYATTSSSGTPGKYSDWINPPGCSTKIIRGRRPTHNRFHRRLWEPIPCQCGFSFASQKDSNCMQEESWHNKFSKLSQRNTAAAENLTIV